MHVYSWYDSGVYLLTIDLDYNIGYNIDGNVQCINNVWCIKAHTQSSF